MRNPADIRSQMRALQEQLRQAEAERLKEFGLRLKAARESAGLTQQQLGDAVEVGRTQVTNLEAGKTDTSMSTLRAICDVLQCSADELMGLTARPTPAQESGQ